MKKYIKISFWKTIFIIITSTLYANNYKTNYNNSIKKNKYKENLYYNRTSSIDSNKLPPTLTNLNNIWKLSNIYIDNNSLKDNIIKNAKEYLGTPYQYGGNSFKGVDCSALVKQAFKPYKFLPRVSTMQAKKGIPINKNNLKKADLVFFSINQSDSHKRKISHVGIILNTKENKILFIHTSRSRGVMISNLKYPYWDKRFVTARRVIKDNYEKKITENKRLLLTVS